MSAHSTASVWMFCIWKSNRCVKYLGVMDKHIDEFKGALKRLTWVLLVSVIAWPVCCLVMPLAVGSIMPCVNSAKHTTAFSIRQTLQTLACVRYFGVRMRLACFEEAHIAGKSCADFIGSLLPHERQQRRFRLIFTKTDTDLKETSKISSSLT